jgi:DNA polymerase
MEPCRAVSAEPKASGTKMRHHQAARTLASPDGNDTPRASSLTQLVRLEQQCTRCPLYRKATQVVPGRGPRRAVLMLVGEQPGNDEDLEGEPFVGPAGRILDRALASVGIDRRTVFVTNAVKHFKFEPRGKRRLHKRPNAYEIDRCKWWNDLERALVKPRLVVAMGATAARSLLGRPISIGRARGQIFSSEDGTDVTVTTHPSAILRMRDKLDRERAFAEFVKDLGHCREIVERSG